MTAGEFARSLFGEDVLSVLVFDEEYRMNALVFY